MTSAIDRALDALIAGRWVLTLEDTADGGREVVAYRPIGWTGPGDPHERLAATDRTEMWRVLTRRHAARAPAPPRGAVTDNRGAGPPAEEGQ